MAGLTDMDQPYPESRLSLQHFRAITRKYLVDLSEVQHALYEIYASLFQEDVAIQPLECREATNALDELHALVDKSNNLLSEPSLLPLAAFAPRYRLLFASQLILEQTRHLIDLFDSYYIMCLKPSPQEERMRKKIQKLFQAVLEHIPDIPRQALYLEEESKSLEQELIAALREK